ncbi:DUF4974 domain-containing protein [Puteibacter caeruleilacunae]|nr:DUF4974 domain-containing protein [Puteibacter caeruleilacunae]
MEKEKNRKLLDRFVRGKYSYDEFKEVKELLQQSESNAEIHESFENQWDDTVETTTDKMELDHVYQRVQDTIQKQGKGQAKKVHLWKIYRYAAAVLLIPIALFSLWMLVQNDWQVGGTKKDVAWVSINAPTGSRVEFQLPDGSTGWLNSGSELKYPPAFKDQREVKLEGEAFFDVEHQKGAKFIVRTKELNVTVLGTKFDVKAYADDDQVDVILEEGKVALEGNVQRFKHVLKPNQQMTFDRNTKQLKLSEVNAKRLSAWKKGYLIINNEALGKVVNRIERWYNVDIEVADEQLRKYRFKATFKDEPLEEMLRILAQTTSIRYEIIERKSKTDGKYERKKVILKLK